MSTIHSVASFFVSRVDTEINTRLEAIGTPDALALKSKAGIANAQLAYEVYQHAFSSERALGLIASGATRQHFGETSRSGSRTLPSPSGRAPSVYRS